MSIAQELPLFKTKILIGLSLVCLQLVLSCNSEPSSNEVSPSDTGEQNGEDDISVADADAEPNMDEDTTVTPNPDEDTASNEDAHSSEDVESSTENDGLAADASDEEDAGEEPETSYCEKLGYPEKPFLSGTGSDYEKIAGFFSAETLNGTWKLDENWTGCDSYVFVNYTGDSTFWNGELTTLINKSPTNVHYFFSGYGNAESVSEQVIALKGRVDQELSKLPPFVAENLAPRMHYVTTPATEIGGSVGAFFKKKTLPALGIDRNQTFQHAASLAIILNGAFTNMLSQVVWLGRYYNYLAEVENTLAEDEEAVTLVPLFSDTEVSANNETYTAEFPSAEVMDGFDTMIADLVVECGPEPQDCGEWDYEAYIQLCEDETCSSLQEILVWITPYSRPGKKHWMIDMTPFLGLVRDGGVKTFRFGMLWNMNKNVLNLNFRLSNRGVGMASKTVIPLVNGGDFNSGYNDKYEPYLIEVPESTTRSELVVIVSGHGQESGNNCAEWCNHQHEFTIDGLTSYTKDHAGEAGTMSGCAEKVDEGVPPGQYGNWAPGRAAWCPGLPVHPWVVDLSEDLTPGATHEITYRGLYQGGEPAGGRIRLNSFLVLYE